jgi:hypothetical protein
MVYHAGIELQEDTIDQIFKTVLENSAVQDILFSGLKWSLQISQVSIPIGHFPKGNPTSFLIFLNVGVTIQTMESQNRV